MGKHSSINRIYRLIWSAAHQTWVAASEVARGRGTSCSGTLLVTALLSSLGSIAIAAPQGGKVTSGDGSISTKDKTTTISQTSDRLNLSWKSFNVGKDETVKFDQPSASSLAVNRILDTNGSQILGRVNANGQVWLINPNGVLFGRDAQINVGSILASTLSPDDGSIGSTRTNFSGSSKATAVNLGTINAAQGGYVALLGHSVSNQGTITAPGGMVALGGGSTLSLQFAGSKLLGLEVSSNQINTLAENGGLIQADGGQVLLSAGARDSLLASVVNNTGVIQVQTVEEHEGRIVLLGGMQAGTTQVGGTLDASAPKGGKGGFIETSAHTVKVADSARITTASAKGTQGRWLIDPVDFTVAKKGGDITGEALGKLLKDNDITIQTTKDVATVTKVVDPNTTETDSSKDGPQTGKGDIFVNDSVKWTSGKTLTLDAWRNIEINAGMDASGDRGGKLVLKYGQGSAQGDIDGALASYTVRAAVNLKAGQNFSTKRGLVEGTIEYTVITELGKAGDESGENAVVNSLQGLAHKDLLSGNYVLGNNIKAGATSDWNGGAGFVPIGTEGNGFKGKFDGLGHTIQNLTISRPGTDFVGLFGVLKGDAVIIRNLGLVDGAIRGRHYVGALLGYNAGTLERSYATANVIGEENVGGLVGTNSSQIYASYAAGTVSGRTNVGGLVGSNYGNINTSYATATVQGSGNNIGGLVGQNAREGGAIGSVEQSYATGAVSGNSKVGGLIGFNVEGTRVNESYATGDVSGTTDVGILVGKNSGSVSNSYYFGTSWTEDYPDDPSKWLIYRDCIGACPSDSQGYIVGGAGTGVDDGAASKQRATYTGFDFSDTWVLYEGHTKPLLRSLMTPLTVTVNASGGKTYDGKTAGCESFSCSVDKSDWNGKVYGEATYTLSAKNAGSYYATARGLYSDQDGYLIQYASGSAATIDKRELVVSGVTAVGKIYDGNRKADITGDVQLNGFVGEEFKGVTATASASFDRKDVGDRTVTVQYQLINKGDDDVAANYTVKNTALTANISRKELLISGITAKAKTYDGTTNASVSADKAIATGLIDGEKITINATGTFADKNVGDKTVFLGSSYSGDTVDNYAITDQSTAQASISQRAITISGIAAESKIYDGKTEARINTANATGWIGGDSFKVDATGTFADKNVGDKTVKLLSTYIGDDVKSYTITDQAVTQAGISKKTLTYNANPAIFSMGTTPTGLGGSVAGFVDGENLDNATTGTLAWETSATKASAAGRYRITGSGLSADNYSFQQAVGNASALTIANSPVDLSSLFASLPNGLTRSTLTASLPFARTAALGGNERVSQVVDAPLQGVAKLGLVLVVDQGVRSFPAMDTTAK